jgi:hypothetical protein
MKTKTMKRDSKASQTKLAIKVKDLVAKKNPKAGAKVRTLGQPVTFTATISYP